MITKNQVKNLPSTIGLYFFKKDKIINYIGKSVNIKARVLSHLENARLDNKEKLIVNNSNIIETITTESEFKALIIEAKLIREFQPKYNAIWKDDKSPLYIKVTIEDEYPKIFLTRKEDSKHNLYFGPFSSVRIVERIIRDIRKIIPFCTQKKVSKKACFYSKIGLCNPCPNDINQSRDKLILKKNYRKNINQVISILRGNVKSIIKDLYQQLNIFIKNNQYEQAIIIRNKIFRFDRLLNLKDASEYFLNNGNKKKLEEIIIILKKYFPQLIKLDRIEAYDISNLGLNQAVGSMVVMKNNQIDKKEYRRFKIKRVGLKSDFDRLGEVIKRRLKQQWPMPDLMVIDGGRPQIKTIMKIFQENQINIPLLGIAKNPDRVIVGMDDYPNLFLKNNSQVLNIIRLLRDESHRFARKYHLFLRSKDFLL
jgi:excinuclease ABC subunit C